MKGEIYKIEFDPMKPVPSRIAFFINLYNGDSTMIEDKMYLDEILEKYEIPYDRTTNTYDLSHLYERECVVHLKSSSPIVLYELDYVL